MHVESVCLGLETRIPGSREDDVGSLATSKRFPVLR